MWPFKKTKTDLFANVPGPSPWYLKSQDSLPNYKWISAGLPETTSGKVYLSDDKDVFLIVDFHHYILPLSETTILVWSQKYAKNSETTFPVKIVVLDLVKLFPLKENLDKLCAKMKSNQIGLIYEGNPIAEIALDTKIVEEPIRFIFPAPISQIDELLILCRSSGIGLSNGWDKQNIALLVAQPSISTYQLYPQEWFNNSNCDFGYQWPTRVTRNLKTGKIHGEGIRISPFILDDTLKNIE